MNIEYIKRKLLIKYPFFGSVVANSNFIAEESVKKADTDGENIYYNPGFIESITNDQQIFVFAHEISHIAFNHILRREGKDKKLWNIATDSVINVFLKQDGLPLVKGSVDIPEAINYDAEEMYKKLLEEKKQHQKEQNNNQRKKDNQKQSSDKVCNKEDQSQNKQQGSSSDERTRNQDKQLQNQNNIKFDENSRNQERKDVGHDTHSMWDKAIEKKYQKEQQNFDKIKNKEQENKNIKKLTELGEKEAFKQNKIERKKQLEELKKTLASQSHGYGNTTNSEKRNIADIGVSKPLIDWRIILKEAVKYDIDWSYQNAEIENGVVTAHLEKMTRPETEIILDTSDSINETLLRNFLRECKNILQTSKVKVGCFDTKFYGFTEIRNAFDIDNLQFYGSGGTNFNVAVNAFTRRVENKIIFTDGDAPMPNTPIDAIWIVFGRRKITPPGGKVIYINEEQLERLNNYQITNEPKRRSR